jgi:hypothetical protein
MLPPTIRLKKRSRALPSSPWLGHEQEGRGSRWKGKSNFATAATATVFRFKSSKRPMPIKQQAAS